MLSLYGSLTEQLTTIETRLFCMVSLITIAELITSLNFNSDKYVFTTRSSNLPVKVFSDDCTRPTIEIKIPLVSYSHPGVEPVTLTIHGFRDSNTKYNPMIYFTLSAKLGYPV